MSQGRGVDRKLFKRYRMDAGLSLREFCRAFEKETGIGLRDSNLSAMEQGRRSLPDHVIELGAAILGRRPEDFPEYRLARLPSEILTDPFADRVLRLVSRIGRLSPEQRRELRASARLLELMEEDGDYSAD